eukprot:1762079-Pyramimonas_sp.AAC.1
MDPITVTVTEGDPDAQKDSMQQKMDEPRSMKDAVKKVMLGNRLSVAFNTLRTQTGDAFLHLDFKNDLTYVKNLGEGAFGTVDWCVAFDQSG